MSFRGDVVQEYTYTYTNNWYRAFEKLISIKKILLKFRYTLIKK